MSIQNVVGAVKISFLKLFGKKDREDNTSKENTKVRKSSTREMVEAILIALVLAIVIRAFVIEPFKIPTGSMRMTLIEGDHLMVNKMSYGFQMPRPAMIKLMGFKVPFLETQLKTWWGEIKRGDVVVFRAPMDRYTNYIKRIIAISGDTIEVKNKVVYINGESQGKESYTQFTNTLNFGHDSDASSNMAPYTVPEGHVFCMGDNRDNSYDSRYWGPVPINDIKGKAFIVYFSRDPELMFPTGMRFDRFFDSIR